MAIAEIGQLHSRYVRLSDKFKALWTYNQFATSVYKNLLRLPLPYSIDFPAIYDSIRRVSDVIQSTAGNKAVPMIEQSERDLQRSTVPLLEADQLITPPNLRRFLDSLKRKDDKKVIFFLIKFYLYADAVEGDQRDKLDFLFTRIGEDYFEARGEYWAKDPGELRRQMESLLSARPIPHYEPKEISGMVNAFRKLKADIHAAESFEKLTERGLVDDSRTLKQKIGDQYFHPDVLLAIIDCNVTARTHFLRFYTDEERQIVEDSQRLLDNEEALARGFGESNPGLMQEISRFRQLKQEFEESRAHFNVKHNLVGQLRASMNNILAQLDRVVPAPAEEMTEATLVEMHRSDTIRRKFGEDPLLHAYLLRMFSTFEAMDPALGEEKMVVAPEAQEMRLEPWEAGTYLRLFYEKSVDPQHEELLLLFLRAAALRLKIGEEATFLAAFPPQKAIEGTLLRKVKESLDRANTYDQQFVDYLHDEINYSNATNLHQLYRSRFRLLRVFSGLWLIYDHFT